MDAGVSLLRVIGGVRMEKDLGNAGHNLILGRARERCAGPVKRKSYQPISTIPRSPSASIHSESRAVTSES